MSKILSAAVAIVEENSTGFGAIIDIIVHQPGEIEYRLIDVIDECRVRRDGGKHQFGRYMRLQPSSKIGSAAQQDPGCVYLRQFVNCAGKLTMERDPMGMRSIDGLSHL